MKDEIRGLIRAVCGEEVGVVITVLDVEDIDEPGSNILIFEKPLLVSADSRPDGLR